MKEIDVGDEVKVKNKNGIFIVETFRQTMRYDNGVNRDVMLYTLKPSDNSLNIVFVEYEEMLPLKSLKQKIDDELDNYNSLILLESIYQDGIHMREAKLILHFLAN